MKGGIATDITFKSTDTLCDHEISLWEKEFDKKRVDAVNRKRCTDRSLSICGDILILNAYKSRYPDKAFKIIRTDKGKPFLENGEFYFSISHKGEMAVCAVNESPVGIDIETVAPFNKRLAERICTEKELLYIGDSELRFTEVWTVKEAYSKLNGGGISIGLRSIIIDESSKTVCGLPFYTEIIDGYVYSWVVSDTKNE